MQQAQYKTIKIMRREIGAQLHVVRSKKEFPLSKLSQITGIAEWKLDGMEMGKYQIQLGELLSVMRALNIGVQFNDETKREFTGTEWQ